MISCGMDFVDENKNFIKNLDAELEARTSEKLIFGCNVYACFMYRKSIAQKIGEYDISLFCAEDYDYWIRIAIEGNIDYCNENLYTYRNQPNSLTSTREKEIADKTNLIKEKYVEQIFKRYKMKASKRAEAYYQIWKRSNNNNKLILKILMNNPLNLMRIILKLLRDRHHAKIA